MKPVSFYLVTDTHYLNNVLDPGGEAFEKNMVTEQFFVKESGAIIRSTFDKIIEDKDTDIVILPGDLVKNGEKESHNGFIKELYRLKENGKKVGDIKTITLYVKPEEAAVYYVINGTDTGKVEF